MNPPEKERPAAGNAQPVRVSVVEDDKVVREQILYQLSHAEGLTCASSHGTGEVACAEIPSHRPDVVLMDINLPGMSGIECVRQLKLLLPRTQFVMLTVYEDANVIFRSLQAGAVGYLLKGRDSSDAQMLKAVRDAASGGSPLNIRIARKIVQHFNRVPSPSATESVLSPRERQVLESLARGLRNKEIADLLAVSIETVNKHCHHIYEKLQVSSRTEAVAKFLRR